MKALLAPLLLLFLASALADPVSDPMRPPWTTPGAAGPAKPAAPSVSAVFISETRRVAVVDGRLIRAGDRVGACLVDEVIREGLRCRNGGYIRPPTTPGSEAAFRKPAQPPNPPPDPPPAVAANGAQ